MIDPRVRVQPLEPLDIRLCKNVYSNGTSLAPAAIWLDRPQKIRHVKSNNGDQIQTKSEGAPRARRWSGLMLQHIMTTAGIAGQINEPSIARTQVQEHAPTRVAGVLKTRGGGAPRERTYINMSKTEAVNPFMVVAPSYIHTSDMYIRDYLQVRHNKGCALYLLHLLP